MSGPTFSKAPKKMTATKLKVSQIVVGTRLREVSALGVERLIDSIRVVGAMKDAIQVRKKHNGEFHLIAGAHRLEAAKRLGWDEIDVQIWTDVTDDWALWVEVDDNLVRTDLTPLDASVFMAERKRIYERRHPETKKKTGKALAEARWDAPDTVSVASFAKAMAERFNKSERTIRRMVALGEWVSQSQLQKLRAAPIKIENKDLEVLAKVRPEFRDKIIDLLYNGEAKSAGQAVNIIGDPGLGVRIQGVASPVDDEYLKVSEYWSRARATARLRFVEDNLQDLKTLIQKCENTSGVADPE